MTTQEIIALAKEKLGKDITEQEAQDYLDGKTAVPDEALELVSGGGGCWIRVDDQVCPKCGSRNVQINLRGLQLHCNNCGYTWCPVGSRQ